MSTPIPRPRVAVFTVEGLPGSPTCKLCLRRLAFPRRHDDMNDLAAYTSMAWSHDEMPLLRLAQDGVIPGATRDERRVGLVARVLVELNKAMIFRDADEATVISVSNIVAGAPAWQSRASRELMVIVRETHRRALDELYGTNRASDLHRAVAELAEALGVEMPLTLEDAETLANAGSVDLGDATVLARLLTHYPSAPEWDADLDELYAWSQA